MRFIKGKPVGQEAVAGTAVDSCMPRNLPSEAVLLKIVFQKLTFKYPCNGSLKVPLQQTAGIFEVLTVSKQEHPLEDSSLARSTITLV